MNTLKLLSGGIAFGLSLILMPFGVMAEETEFDLNDFYVCDEFMEYGTAGKSLDFAEDTLVDTSEVISEATDTNESRDGEYLRGSWPDTIDYSEDKLSSIWPAKTFGTENRLSAIIAGAEDSNEGRLGVTVTPLRMSSEGIAMLEGFEGCRLTAYKALSTETYYTIGYGHYGPDVTEGMTITQAQAEELLRQDLASRENYLNGFASDNKILFRQNEFDAILSLIFNIGTGNFSDSTIRRYILEGFENHTDEDDTTAIGMWRKSGGQVIQGLVNRRAKESALFTRYGVKRPEMRDASLGLNGRIGLYMYIYIPDKITAAEGAYILHVKNGVPSNIYLSQLPHEGQVYCVKSDFAAKEIDTAIAIALVDASGVVYPIKNSNTEDGFTYYHSLGKFRESAAAAGQTNLVKLADDMNQYGLCAWSYFNSYNYSPQGEINNVSSTVFAPYEKSFAGKVPGISYVGSSLLLESGTTIRHYFRVAAGYSISDFRFEIGQGDGGNGSSATIGTGVMAQKEPLPPSPWHSLYYIEINNIPPTDYDNYYLTKVSAVNNADNSAMTIKYCVYSYANSVFAGDNTELLKNVMRAMYLYGNAAKNSR